MSSNPNEIGLETKPSLRCHRYVIFPWFTRFEVSNVILRPIFTVWPHPSLEMVVRLESPHAFGVTEKFTAGITCVTVNAAPELPPEEAPTVAVAGTLGVGVSADKGVSVGTAVAFAVGVGLCAMCVPERNDGHSNNSAIAATRPNVTR